MTDPQAHSAGSDEETVLAPYAQRAAQSRGRRVPEPPPGKAAVDLAKDGTPAG